MQIDVFTVLISGIFVKLVLSCLFLVFWLFDRRSVWFVWWSATYLIGMLAALVFLTNGFGGAVSRVGAGSTAMIATFGLLWQGSRSFQHRPPYWPPVFAALALWLGACLIPGFLEQPHLRVVLSSVTIAVLSTLSAYEFWRGREERLLSRWPVILLFMSLSVFFLSRVVFINVLPFPFGAEPSRPDALALFNMVVFFHTLVLTVLFVAISKERLELQQRTNAQTDSLTGALNRRALMSRGERLLKRHEYERVPLCFLLLDLDRFKALNDRFGHVGGDEVLTKFVAVVHDSIRPTDYLFRLGGEEFCCLLPRTGGAQAQAIAERVRLQVEGAIVVVTGAEVRTTVSIGLASTETCGYDLDRLMRQADTALYTAKSQGRNRVVVAGSHIAPEAPVIPPAAAPSASLA